MKTYRELEVWKKAMDMVDGMDMVDMVEGVDETELQGCGCVP